MRCNKNPVFQMRQEFQTFGHASLQGRSIAYASLQHKAGLKARA